MGNIAGNCRNFCQVSDFSSPEITHNPIPGQGILKTFPKQISTIPNVRLVHQSLNLNSDWLLKTQPIRLERRKAFYYGEAKDHKPIGLARIVFDDGSFFEGKFENGSVNCSNGLFIYMDGSYYQGGIKGNKANGRGKIVYKTDQTLIYDGEWQDDLPHGHGKQMTKCGWQYVGFFVKGVKQGKGRLQWPDGDFYIGQFNDGFITGEGQMVSANGSYRYRGKWLKNKKNGQGQEIFNEGFIYHGKFINDLRDGPGKWIDRNQEATYVKYKQGVLLNC